MPAPKKLTPNKIDVFVITARQITECDVPADLRRRLDAIVAEVDALRGVAPSLNDHQPVYLPKEAFPGHMQQIGCSCGHKPKTPNQRSSTMMNSYRAHLTRIGAPRNLHENPTYTEGEFKGMTWSQRYAIEKERGTM